MIARLADLSEREIDEMDAIDLAGIGEIVEGFMAPGLPTGPIFSAS